MAAAEFIPEILELMAAFNAIDHYPFDKETGRQNLKEFLNNDGLGRLWTIHYEDQVLGYVVLTFGFSFEYNGRDAFIDGLFIKGDFRNKGIGRNTMRFVEEQAKQLGVKALHLEVEGHNDRGNKLYLKEGYKGNIRKNLTLVFF